MKILVLGSGGREHAFAYKLAQSPKCTHLFVAPGNAGTAQIAQNIPLNPNDFEKVKNLVLREQIDLVVVGPEEPLVLGIVDFFKEDSELHKIQILGPGSSGAQLEGSKDFSKRFMMKYGIPTAEAQTFTSENLEAGIGFLEKTRAPFVLKADGLAAGKGVIISEDVNEAKTALKEMLLDQKFGAAGSKVLIEQFLKGIELSVFVLTDGKDYIILPEAKDYKRIGENDTGLNTGGMGAVSPVPFADEVFNKKIEERIIIPTIEGLKKERIPYVGFLFFGLIEVENEPYVIEYNVRMGDPETEAVFARIENDFVDLLQAAANGRIGEIKLGTNPDFAVTTMIVSGGYPENYRKGLKMEIPENVGNDVILFHAGTRLENHDVLTNGGRVIAVTGLGKTLTEALEKSQKIAREIKFEQSYFRKDIGIDLKKYL